MSESTGTLSTAATSSDLEELPADMLADVEKLLGGEDLDAPETVHDEPAPGGDTKAPEEEPEGEPEPETDEHAAPDKFDYAQEVPIANEGPQTVGALKDFYQQHRDTIDNLHERENALMVRYQMVNNLASQLQISPELQQQIDQQQREHLAREHQLMLQCMPELNTPAGFEKTKAAIAEHLRGYGIPMEVLGAHNYVKLVRDAVSDRAELQALRAELKAIRQNIRPVKSPEPKAIRRNGAPHASEIDQATARAKQTRNEGDVMHAADLLLRG